MKVYFHIWIQNSTCTSVNQLCCDVKCVTVATQTVKSLIDYIWYIISSMEPSGWSRKYLTFMQSWNKTILSLTLRNRGLLNMNYINNMWRVNTLVLDWIDNWDIVTLCFITPIKEVCLNWQNFIGYRYRWLMSLSTVLLVKEIGVPGENRWSVPSSWQTSSHNVVSSTHRLILPYKRRSRAFKLLPARFYLYVVNMGFLW